MVEQGATWPVWMPLVVAAVLVALGLAALILWSPVYKHIICLKYLFSGWKAVVPLVSALPAALGVFLLILVFAIMDGFANETQEMTRGTLSDIIVDARLEGLPYYDDFIRRIEQIDGIAAATPIVQTYAIVRVRPQVEEDPGLNLIKPFVRPCIIIGIRPEEKVEMGRFHQYLQRQQGPQYPAAGLLKLPPAWASGQGPPKPGCIAGVGVIGYPKNAPALETVQEGVGRRILLWTLAGIAIVMCLFIWKAARRRPGRLGWRIAKIAAITVVVALAVAAILTPIKPVEIERTRVVDEPLVDYGGDVVVSTIPIRASGGIAMEPGGIPKVASRALTLVDTFKSGYWEADSSSLYVDFAVAQQMAGMDAQPAQEGRPAVPARASQVQVKVRDPAQSKILVKKIQDAWMDFQRVHPDIGFLQPTVNTWQEQQRMILTVVEVEKNVTALMLGMMFLGFVVLIGLISYVMAFIKSRDIGILKAVGARDTGVGSLFLGYGFIIGLIGAAVGMGGALLMLHYLDAIEIWVNQTLHIDVFPREMYYFDHIPQHLSTTWCIMVGLSVLVLSTLASMAGGLLAAIKQPVETLRYE